MKRNVSLDALRILAMWFILTAHFLGWGGAVNTLTPHDYNYYWVMTVYFISQTGNTLFFMLAGYFAKKPRLEKGLLLWRKTVFYSSVITWAVCLGGGVTLSYAVRSLFPILFNKYWFVSVYLVLYAIELILVPGLRSLSKSRFVIVIAAVLVNNTIITDAKYTLLEGLAAFMIGFYIKEHKPFENVSKSKVLIAYTIAMLAYAAERIIALKLAVEHGKWDNAFRYLLLLLAATLLFGLFENIDINWKWPCRIAPYIIAVYLITANPAITEVLYVHILRVSEYSDRAWFFAYYVIINAVFIIICTAIDHFVTRWNQYEVRWVDSTVLSRLR